MNAIFALDFWTISLGFLVWFVGRAVLGAGLFLLGGVMDARR